MQYYLQNSYSQMNALLESADNLICPQKLYIDITEDCNLHCQMCRDSTSICKKIMPMDLFKSIVDETCPFVRSYSLFNWGEPLLLDDFFERVDYVLSKKRAETLVDISTNGMLLNEKTISLLFAKGILTTVSFDGATKDSFERIRRGASFEMVTDNTRKLASAFCNAQLTYAPAIYISIQKDNQYELYDIIKLAQSLGIRRVGMGIVTSPDKFAPDQSRKLCDELERAYAFVRQNDMLCDVCPTKVGEYLLCGQSYEHMSDYILDTNCTATLCSATVAYSGDVYLCCNEGALVGNIRDKSFLQLWQSEAYAKLRRAVNAPHNRPRRCVQCAWFNRN